MGSPYTIESRGDYILVTTGDDFEIAPEVMSKFWPDLAAACVKHGCHRVLIEGGVVRRRMAAIHAFRSGSDAARHIPGLSLAMYIHGYVPDDLTALFKNVASNRGARIEFFSDRAEGLRWLGVDPAKHTIDESS
jgi:hypothetical protein